MSTPQVWRASRRVFVKRALLVALLTYVVLYGVPTLLFNTGGQIQLTLILLQVILISTFFFDDAVRWRKVRNAQWSLSGGTLTLTDDDGEIQIPLNHVKAVKTRLGTVILVLQTGQRIPMRYLPQPQQIARTLEDAMPPAPRA